MLRINRQTDYAVRTLLCLAHLPEGTRLSTAQIQREMLIPPTFLPRIVARLAAVGLVITYPGRDGGVVLSRPAKDISIKDVVEAFEGPMCLSDCMEGGDVDCPFEVNCPVRSRWDVLQARILQEMAAISFQDLAADSRST